MSILSLFMWISVIRSPELFRLINIIIMLKIRPICAICDIHFFLSAKMQHYFISGVLAFGILHSFKFFSSSTVRGLGYCIVCFISRVGMKTEIITIAHRLIIIIGGKKESKEENKNVCTDLKSSGSFMSSSMMLKMEYQQNVTAIDIYISCNSI